MRLRQNFRLRFTKLAGTGFFPTSSLVANAPTLSMFVSAICAPPLGFWGGISWCGENKPIVGAKIKLDNTKGSSDKSGLTGVQMRCAASEFSSAEKLALQRIGGSYNKTGLMMLLQREAAREQQVVQLTSAEASVGVWSSWNDCPAGEYISGMKTRTNFRIKT